MDAQQLYGRIAEIAPEWNPFPLLNQLDTMSSAVGQMTMNPGAAYGGADPNASPIPQLPQNQQPPGAQMLPQGGYAGMLGGGGAAPLSPQQTQALGAMGRGGAQPQGARAPAMQPHGPKGAVSLSPLQLPNQHTGPRMGLAQLLGMR